MAHKFFKNTLVPSADRNELTSEERQDLAKAPTPFSFALGQEIPRCAGTTLLLGFVGFLAALVPSLRSEDGVY